MGVRCVVADWGTQDPAIAALLDKLQGSRQIPFLAIFPAGAPEKAIRLAGLYNREQLIKALEKAGPSESKSSEQNVAEETKPTIRVSRLP